MKRIEIDGKFYRVRRGELVQIPDQWVGKIVTEQTKRNRPSKQIGKLARQRRRYSDPGHPTGPMGLKYIDGRDQMIDEDA